MMSVKLNDLDFWNIKDSDYWFIIKLINKKETMNLLQNGDLTEKSGTLIKKNFFLESIYKNRKKNHKIWWYCNQKTKISSTWKIYFNKKIHINKIVESNKVSFEKKRFKYFIGYKDAKRVKASCKFFSQKSADRKDFNEAKYIYIFGQNLINN